MAKIDITLKKLFAIVVVVCLLLTTFVIWINIKHERDQLEREIIYIKARERVAQQQHERTREWKKRRIEQQLRQQYNQGRVAGKQPIK